MEIKNLEIPYINHAQEVPTSFITFDPLDASGNKIGHSQTLYDNNQLTSAQLNNIADTQVHIANFRGEVGAKLNLLERQNTNLSERDLAIKKDLSDLEDADLAALVTDLKAQLTGLQASQQAFVKISNINLNKASFTDIIEFYLKISNTFTTFYSFLWALLPHFLLKE